MTYLDLINIKYHKNKFLIMLSLIILSLIIYSDLKQDSSAQRIIVQTFNFNLETNKELTLEDIIKIDYIDSHREVDPLKKADDAIEIDSSNYNINEVTEIICNYIENILK